jgi:hypothetical protein
MTRFHRATAAVAVGATLLVLSMAAYSRQKDTPQVAAAPALKFVYQQVNQQFQAVKPVFQYSCYDCHSDQTKYPWYHKLPGIKNLIDNDIREGREHLDMSSGFPFPGTSDQIALLAKIRNEISNGDMPPMDFRMLHWGRLIEGARQDSVFAWIDAGTLMLKQLQSGN